MTDDEIKEIIRRLDEVSPADEAWATIREVGGGPDESGLTANRAGYLRMAMHFLEGAVAEHDSRHGSSYISISLDDVLKNETDVAIDSFRRVETPMPSEPEQPVGGKLIVSGCLIVSVICILCIITGAVTIVLAIGQWLFGTG